MNPESSGTLPGLLPLDWAVVIVYLIGMIGLSAWLSRQQHSKKDYYLGGNRNGALPVALSTLATQCSTNSLLGAPAFVAFSAAGGMLWLQYELALPAAMLILMGTLLPAFRGLGLISIYSYLEERFGLGTRTLVSVLFQLLRAFGTGVTVYGVSQVLSLCMGVPFIWAVMMLGVVTIIYDFLGGMRAVILSDVIQLILIFGTVIAALIMGVHLCGGWEAMWAGAPDGRKTTIDFSGHGLGDGADYGFWPMLFGGFTLYLAYYGCDQTQAQRSLSTKNVADTQKALFLGGILRFPLVLAYCLLGLVLAAYATLHPEFIGELPARAGLATTVGAEPQPDYNLAVPVFVLRHFPTGLIGLVMVGLFAAAMSSLDSTLNSLSATTAQDIVSRFRPQWMRGATRETWVSRFITLFWGVVCMAFSFCVGGISDSIVTSINKIGSLLNGPLLGVFLLGLWTRRVGQPGALIGLLSGLGLNALLWKFAPQISWLWWNVIGLVMCVFMAWLITLLAPRPSQPAMTAEPTANPPPAWTPVPRRYAVSLIVYSALIIMILWGIQALA